MRSNRLVVLLLLLAIACAGLVVVLRSRRPRVETDIRPISGLATADSPETPEGRHVAILKEYVEADRRAVEAVRAAPDERKGAELLRRRELRRTFADRFLALARDSAGDTATGDAIVDGLTWAISQCPDDPQGRQAVEQLLQGPISSERLATACQRLDAEESPIAEPVFRAVLARNPHASARAQASLALARALRRRSERVGPARGAPRPSTGLAREAESLYGEVIARYGQLRVGRETLAEVARAELFELRRLGVGHEAPEIEGPDLQGRPMALSDFRGKVVVLEFWGDW